jgi:acyl-CoA thioesterase
MDADDKACAVAAAMWAKDKASQNLGMVLTQVGAGRATLTMTVRDEHCNGFGLLHGGLLATLADSAFAFACNSSNTLTVASGFDIDIVKSAEVGDELLAEARCLHQGGRSGVYEVVVKRGDELIALFRGRSQRLKGRFVAPELES